MRDGFGRSIDEIRLADHLRGQPQASRCIADGARAAVLPVILSVPPSSWMRTSGARRANTSRPCPAIGYPLGAHPPRRRGGRPDWPGNPTASSMRLSALFCGQFLYQPLLKITWQTDFLNRTARFGATMSLRTPHLVFPAVWHSTCTRRAEVRVDGSGILAMGRAIAGRAPKLARRFSARGCNQEII